MSKQLSVMVPANVPFNFEGLDMRPAFRAGQGGEHTYSVSIMVTEEMWESLKTIPRHHIIGGVLFWTSGDPVGNEKPIEDKPAKEPKQKKPPKPKGDFGAYWEILVGHNSIFNHPDLQSVMPMNMGSFDESVWTGYKDCLKAVFEVDSLTFISPEQFEKFLEDKGLFNVVTISRQAVAKLKEK